MSPRTRPPVATSRSPSGPTAVDAPRTPRHDEHVRDLIEQLLFTSPGERVMRPDFGCGLLDLVFAPNSPELASTPRALRAGLACSAGSAISSRWRPWTWSARTTSSACHLLYAVRATGTRRDDVFEGRAAA